MYDFGSTIIPIQDVRVLMSTSCTLLLTFALNKMQDVRMSLLGSCTSILVAGSHSDRLETHEYRRMEMYQSCNSSEKHPLEEWMYSFYWKDYRCRTGSVEVASQLDKTGSALMTGFNKTITGSNRLAALLSRAGDLNSGSHVVSFQRCRLPPAFEIWAPLEIWVEILLKI